MSRQLRFEAGSHSKITLAVAVGAAGLLAVAGCSSSSSEPSASPSASTSAVSPSATPTPTTPTATPTHTTATPTPTHTTKKPTPTPTKAPITTYKIKGGTVTVSGSGSPKYVAEGGTIVVDPNNGSGTGTLAASINVASSCCAQFPSPWTMHLVTDANGVVISGTLQGDGSKYVLGKGGKINWLTFNGGTTLVTTTRIPAMRGTETPVKIAIELNAK
ncbi:MAG: hypothetical protein WCI74_15985 [Actinomycetes bacterium]